jgi:hypothetical protein
LSAKYLKNLHANKLGKFSMISGHRNARKTKGIKELAKNDHKGRMGLSKGCTNVVRLCHVGADK